MNKDKQALLEHILLQTRFQRFAPPHAKKPVPKVDKTPDDPVLQDYRAGRISKAEVCRYLGIRDKDLFRTLVEKGELFGE